MSRIGKRPILVSASVKVEISGRSVLVGGPKGELVWSVPDSVVVEFDRQRSEIRVLSDGNSPKERALHGLTRAIVNNMVVGVVAPFEKKLEIQGVGYQASLNKSGLQLNVGYSHPVVLPLPAGVACALTDATHIVLQSCDKHAVGQFAAVIREVRPPEPYKGKGIRYVGEYVRRKAGKAFGTK